ncbi:MAG: hypothetical protein ACM3PY_05915 [Omnitrophica WOR_2 bacterium]
MKRKLDLNEPGTRIIALASFFLILIPGLLVFFAWLLSSMSDLIWIVIKISVGAGLLILVILAALMIVETIQDRRYDRWYRQQRHKKMKLSGDYYECQYCGYQKIRDFDKSCPVCNKELS